jgi:hypothetical protein
LPPAIVKKLLLIVVGAVAALLLALYVVADFFLGSLVKTGVAHYGPGITGTPVSLEDAHFSPLSGEGTLTGLVVGNPKGWTSDRAFSFGKIHVVVRPASVFGDQIVVKEIEIEDQVFDYETRVVSSNIGQLLSQIEGRKPGDAGQATTKSGKPIKFVVQHLILRGGRITLGVGPTAIALPMPTLELRDLGGGTDGVDSVELAQVVMRAVAQSVASATVHAAGKIGATATGAAVDGAKGAASALESLFRH